MHTSTQRLTIDALRAEDAAALFEYRADPRVSRYQGWQPHSINDALGFIETSTVVVPDKPGSWYQRAIRLRDSAMLVGDLGLHFVADPERTVEIGITIAPAHQGQGLASEALREALGYVFDDLQQHRVFASIDPRNHACMQLLERVGMRKEAHFRESLWLGGQWVDDVVFAMLAREWPAHRAPPIHHG